MKIIYISSVSNNKSAGFHYSVPAQIKSQSLYDDVIWINISHKHVIDFENINYYIESSKFKEDLLPKEFKNVDLIVFEGVYYYFQFFAYFYCRKNKIPYIIIPRGALTNGAQNKSKIKKKIFNFLFFKKFVKKSLFVEFLTLNEMENSKKFVNKKYRIIPNGIQLNEPRVKNNYNAHIFSFIGRFDYYHKGLDLLIEAINNKKDILNNCVFNLYGASKLDDSNVEFLNKLIEKHQLKNINIFPPVYDEEKINILKNTDIFVLTSRFEGLPMGLLEALSLSIPCLVTKNTNMGDEIKKFDAGWVTSADCDSIGDGLSQIINSKDLSKKSKNAYQLSLDYSWDAIAIKTHNIYESELKGNK